MLAGPLVSSGLLFKYIKGIFDILAQILTFRELISILAEATVTARFLSAFSVLEA